MLNKKNTGDIAWCTEMIKYKITSLNVNIHKILNLLVFYTFKSY